MGNTSGTPRYHLGDTYGFSIGNGEHLGNTSIPLRGHLWFFHRKRGTPREHLGNTSDPARGHLSFFHRKRGTPREHFGDTYRFSMEKGNTSGTPRDMVQCFWWHGHGAEITLDRTSKGFIPRTMARSCPPQISTYHGKPLNQSGTKLT